MITRPKNPTFIAFGVRASWMVRWPIAHQERRLVSLKKIEKLGSKMTNISPISSSAESTDL
jgi:hypothetical protein